MFGSLVLSLLACKNGGKIEEVAFQPGDIVGTGTVTWVTKAEGQAHVEHSPDGGKTWLSTPEVAAADGAVAVLGLQVATEHSFKVVVKSDKDPVVSEVVKADVAPPPAGTPPFRLSRWVPEESCLDGGYVLFSTLGAGKSGLGIVARDAKYVWAMGNDTPDTLIARVRPGRDGQSILWNVAHADRTDDVAQNFRMALDGSGRVATRTLNGHHDFVELPDESTIAWLGYEFRDLVMPELGIEDPDPVVADVVYEGPEGMTNADDAVDIWNMFESDDWPAGITVSGPEMEKCPSISTDPEFDGGGFIPWNCEYSHGNSLAYLPEDDAYLVMFRWLDTLVKIDRASGELVWVFGGSLDMFDGAEQDRFIHGHFSEAWQAADGLHVLIVDNHDADSGVTQEDSKYTEFVLDEDAKTFERTWMYQSDKFETLLGDIRRMPVEGCDNLLISFSNQGRIVEMTRAGDIVWDIGLPFGNVTSRVTFLPDLYDFSGTAYPE